METQRHAVGILEMAAAFPRFANVHTVLWRCLALLVLPVCPGYIGGRASSNAVLGHGTFQCEGRQ
eukprot:3057414-Lingulodinium_polyedra.AAC.1